METKSIVQMTVAVLVAVVVFATVLIPITNTATAETLEYHNTGQYFAEPDGQTHTIVYTPGGSMTFDGVEIQNPDFTYGSTLIAFGYDTENDLPWVVRLSDNGRIVFAGPNNAFDDVGTGISSTVIDTSGNISITVGDNTQTRNGVTMYVSNSGDYVRSQNPYVLDNTQIYAPLYVTSTPTQNIHVFEVVSGTMDNLSAEICRIVNNEVSTDRTISVDTYEIEKGRSIGDLYQIEEIKQHLETTGGMSKDVTITLFLVPASIEYDNPTYTGSTNAALIGIIPVLVIMGLILGVMGFAIVRRYDL